jgi:hypothetical protein
MTESMDDKACCRSWRHAGAVLPALAALCLLALVMAGVVWGAAAAHGLTRDPATVAGLALGLSVVFLGLVAFVVRGQHTERGGGHPAPRALPRHPPADASLLTGVCAMLTRWGGADAMAASDPAPLFAIAHRRSVSVGIAGGRGGYPDWPAFVADAREALAAYDALVAAFGPTDSADAAYFASVRRSLPADAPVMGRAPHPRVDLVAGRLHYIIPWGDGACAFAIAPADLDRLRHDRWRRATLEVVTQALVAHRSGKGERFTSMEFAALLRRILHDRPDGAVA